MKTSENEDKEMPQYLKNRKPSLNPVTPKINREKLHTATGGFVRGGGGNLDPVVDIGWEEAERKFVEWEMQHRTICDNCPEGPFEQCEPCWCLDGGPEVEPRPRNFEVSVRRMMPRNSDGNLAWQLLPLFK